MATSVVRICNLALGYVGISTGITSLDEESAEARACDTYYEQVRDDLLRDYLWPFATKYATLALVSEFDIETDPEANDWGYAFRLPTDCIRVHRILTPSGDAEATPYPFDLGHDSQGRLLFCDLEEASIRYTERITDPNLFSSDFAKALAWSLAAEISFPLSINEQLRQRALDQARMWASKAASSALNERQARSEPDSQFIRARD